MSYDGTETNDISTTSIIQTHPLAMLRATIQASLGTEEGYRLPPRTQMTYPVRLEASPHLNHHCPHPLPQETPTPPPNTASPTPGKPTQSRTLAPEPVLTLSLLP